MPPPSLVLSPDDAAQLGSEAGVRVALSLEDTARRVEIQVDAATPSGTAALFTPSTDPAALPLWIDLRRAIRPERRAA